MNDGKAFLGTIGCMGVLALVWLAIIVAVVVFAIVRFS